MKLTLTIIYLFAIYFLLYFLQSLEYRLGRKTYLTTYLLSIYLALMVGFRQVSFATSLLYGIVTILLVLVAIVDLRYRKIPNQLNLLLLLFSVLNLIIGKVSLFNHLTGLLLMIALFVFSVLFTHGETGGGDFKLLLALGLFLGYSTIYKVVIIATIFGILVSYIKKILSEDSTIPYGLFISISVIYFLIAR